MTPTHSVTIHHQGETHVIEVPEDRSILAVANDDRQLNLPSSCTAGVCTTCAALITEGSVDQTDGMGVSPELQAQGYALLCVAYPRSAVTLKTEQEDVVYQLQFGKPS